MKDNIIVAVIGAVALIISAVISFIGVLCKIREEKNEVLNKKDIYRLQYLSHLNQNIQYS
jgi:hypothetical protein